MVEQRTELDLEEELLILLFWAYGRDISRKLGAERLRAVAGLENAIEAVAHLPMAIGWDDGDLRAISADPAQDPSV
jgi:hypothetical protein